MANQDIESVQMRNACLIKIIDMTRILMHEFGVLPNFPVQVPFAEDVILLRHINIDLSNEISGCLSTVYGFLRKEQNSTTAGVVEKMRGYEVTIGGVTKTIVALASTLRETTGLFPLNYKIMTPLINNLTCFKSVYNEVRIGPVAEIVNQDRSVRKSLRKYTLNNPRYSPLFVGRTFPPEHKSGLAMSLGPMTNLINMIESDPKYKGSIAETVKKQLAHIPEIECIIDALKGNNFNYLEIDVVKKLADLLLICGGKVRNKIHYPLLYFFYICCKPHNEKPYHYFAIPDWFSFTGLQAMVSNSLLTQKVKFLKRSLGTKEDNSEVLFHAFYGTYVEDLGILEWATGRSLKTRGQLSDVFKTQSIAPIVEFPLFPFKYFSKMCVTDTFNVNINKNAMISCSVVLGGKRVKTYNDAFREYMASSNFQIKLQDLNQMSSFLEHLRIEKMKAIEEGERLIGGNVSWMDIDGMTDANYCPVEKGVYFY